MELYLFRIFQRFLKCIGMVTKVNSQGTLFNFFIPLLAVLP